MKTQATQPIGIHLSIAVVLIALTIGLGYFVAQSSFIRILGFYLPFFLLYGLVYSKLGESRLNFWLAVAVALRVLLLFGMPALSDDVYRFIWDGRLLTAGYNPFDHLPSYYMENGVSIPGIEADLYQQLNSPGYFTIYPPVAQATFALSTYLFPNSIIGSTLVMKVFLFGCELGVIGLLVKLLRHFKLAPVNVLLYALNPLLIVEITGNLHYEGAMIFFLLLGFWWLLKDRWVLSALAIALSIASKLLPLMFLPFLIRRLGWRKSIGYFLVLGGALGLMFLPLLSGVFLSNFGESLDLYFRKFEFNASIYYVFRWIGFQQVGYNQIAKIGPRLAMITLSAIMLFTLLERDKTWRALPSRWLFAICVYLFLTTTVHPWYVGLPVVLCLFTPFRFPILWSGLICLTYINYSYDPYWENLWVVALEYLLVMSYMGYECWVNRHDWEFPPFLKDQYHRLRGR